MTPDRIWLDWKYANTHCCAYDEPPTSEYQDAQTPYIRADLVQRMVDEAVEKERGRALQCLHDSPLSVGDGDDLLEQFDRICAAIRKGEK